MNPFLPLNEYIPDGEPHVFGDRVYLYGSHDQARSDRFCVQDYTVSAEGVLEMRTELGVLGTILIQSSACWTNSEVDVSVPDGVHALYFQYHGTGKLDFLQFTFS